MEAKTIRNYRLFRDDEELFTFLDESPCGVKE